MDVLDTENVVDKPHIIIINKPDSQLDDLMKLHYDAIPPINTDILFNLPPFKSRLKIESNFPENFSWMIVTQEDNQDIILKKKYIYPVINQELCGSCYAMCSATSISDSLVISGITDYFPNISTTFAMTCFKAGNNCNGGDPASLLKEIARKGISTNECLDYSWCNKNKKCKDVGVNSAISNANLNLIVPKCQCKVEDTPLYFIKNNLSVISININLPRTKYFNSVKNHILNVGPLIAGFLVKRNFINGKFNKINNGIYFENGIYYGDQIQFEKVYNDSYIGGHAVEIIGWGIAKNTIINSTGETADVPYWHCKNSWGNKWGTDGTFKMPVYPYNKIIQFDVIIENLGGMINFYPDNKIETMADFQYRENFTNNKNFDYRIFIVIIIILVLLLLNLIL